MKQFLLSIFMLLPMMASADAVEINGIYYNLNSEKNQAEVTTNPNKYTGDVKIPEKVPYNDSEYNVTSIGNQAFSGCSGLTSVTIPISVTSIGSDAFRDCSGLTSVTIPNSVKSVGEWAFSGCSGLTSITIPNNLTSIEWGAFYWCTGLTSVTIPNSVTSIVNWAFGGCSGLTSITIPNSVTSIGSFAFDGCRGLTSITIPNSVTSIGNRAFENCSGLTSIVSEIDDLFEITENVFPISNTIVLTIPVGTKSAYLSTAGWNKFKNIFEVGEEIIVIGQVYESGGIYYKIDVNNTVSVISGESKYSGDIIIPSQVVFGKTSYSVTSIDNRAFYGCDGLTSITIPNSVTSIGSDAFRDCSGLTSITIPNSVTDIGWLAFYYCSGLTSVTIPNSVTRIGMCAFSGCSSLTSIRVESGNPKYDSRDDCNAIVETSSNKLIQGCNNTTISNSVTSIGENAFRYYSALTSVTIPNSVTSIGEYAFDECSALTSVIIPKSVASIDECAFYNNSLTYIKIEAEYPPLSDIHAFSRQTYINAILAVPIGTKEKYLATEGWNRFINIIEGNSPEEEGDDEEDDDDFNALGTPLTFEAIEGTVTVNVRNYFCSNTPTIQYRVDNGPWTDFTLTHTECHGAPLYSNFIPAGKIVQLRCNDWPYMLNRLDESSAADGLSIQCDADCYVYGNVMSLETYYYSTDYDKECTLSWLFYQNTHIKNHPKKPLVLPSKTLGMNCYTGMFYGCTGLTMAPELSATELPGCDSYRGGCYESMFQDCTSLTVAPVLPASVLTESCYKKMFYGCTNLNTVTNYATDISAKDATQKWLFGVSSTGTFTKLPSMNAWGDGASGIPYGWNVVAGSSQGDINGDGALDENDLKVLVNHIMGNPHEGYFDLDMADVNKDGTVDVADLVLMLNIINQK